MESVSVLNMKNSISPREQIFDEFLELLLPLIIDKWEEVRKLSNKKHEIKLL